MLDALDHGFDFFFRRHNILAEGKIISDCLPRHRHQEWIKFLKKIDTETPPDLDLHLIVDNYATHKHPKVMSWLKRHPRFHLHFTPTSSSWLNVIERWFRDLTQNRLRKGVFRSVAELIQAIRDYIAHHNANPKSFVWTKKAEDILVLDVRKISSVTDYFVIASGTSEPHLRAIVDEISDTLREDHDLTPDGKDGTINTAWVVLDYFDVMVHVMRADVRQRYDLEGLWNDALRVKPKAAAKRAKKKTAPEA